MRNNTPATIPVIDLFAGPGGLGEGFASFTGPQRQRRFRIALSIEKDNEAHSTLELRSFFRQFPSKEAPESYYLHLRGQLSRNELFELYPEEAASAREQAWKAELGKADTTEVDRRIRKAIGERKDWVLCGGPPCQAYSVIGRSRNRGIDAGDENVYLYKEYLRILSEHQPPVFVMENVKGLLSSKVGETEIFKQMLDDLRQPGSVLKKSSSSVRYSLYSLVQKPSGFDLEGNPDFEAGDFVIKCEDYGIPQSRHRVIILGIRKDMADRTIPVLHPLGRRIPAAHVLKGLPRLRSGISRTTDGVAEWRKALSGILEPEILDGTPNGKQDILQKNIARMLERMRAMRADRGGEFVPCHTKTKYGNRWYSDTKIGGVCNHASRNHMAEDLHRYLFVASYAKLTGRSPELREFPPRLLPNHKNIRAKNKKDYFGDRFRVQLATRPATTVTCHIAKDGHYYIHFDETQVRSLTVREAARLQTFPDNYMFCGNRTHQYTQVGNAVPPLLARQIAEIVFQILHRDVRTARLSPAVNTKAAKQLTLV